MEIISKNDAKINKLKRYFTGIPCKNNHIAERLTSNGDCMECKKNAAKRNYDKNKSKRQKYYQENREEIIHRQQERDAKRKDEIKEYQQQYRKTHREENKEYQKEYYTNNADEQKQKSRKHYNENIEYYNNYNKQYYEQNTEEMKQYQTEYYYNNRELILENKKDYLKENRPEFTARNAKRRATKMQATPKWCEYDKIKELYNAAAILTESGVEHHVDHIIPLQNDIVCGLHCISNLQVLTADENLKKGNKFEID